MNYAVTATEVTEHILAIIVGRIQNIIQTDREIRRHKTGGDYGGESEDDRGTGAGDL